MKNTPCFECGQKAEYDHHVVPLSLGGTKTVPLCADCHGKTHNITMSNLTAKAMRRLKDEDRYTGGKVTENQLLGSAINKTIWINIFEMNEEMQEKIVDLIAQNLANGVSYDYNKIKQLKDEGFDVEAIADEIKNVPKQSKDDDKE